MGETWGISGPTFLLLYVVLTAVVLIASRAARRRIGASGRTGPVTGIVRQPHDVAYLNGGAELAVVSALTALRLRGAISSDQGHVQRVPHTDPRFDGLERALYSAIDAPTHRRRLPTNRAVAAVLAAIDKRLVDAGLLLSDAQRRRVRRVGWWMGGVAALGLLRLLAGIANAKPVGLLGVALVVVTVIAGLLLSTAPRRTRLGDATLAALRNDNHALDPKEVPDWALYGPAVAALGIGLFGMTAVWASDPAIAGELAVQRVSSSGGSSDSSGGDSGGGCGGGGCGGGCGG